MKKNLKKAILILASIATPGIIALSAIACATPKQKPVVALSGEIKYLAFGDSVSAGYNAQMGFDAPGKMENGEIQGLSYPAFIAKYIQQLDSKRLTSFDNYGLSGSTVKDWLYILGNQEYKQEAKKNLDRFLKQDTQEDNPANIYAGRIAQQFGKMGDDPKDFDGFKAKIKEANLITVSLGANDFLRVLYSIDLSAITSAKDEQSKKAALDAFGQSLSDAGKAIVSDMIKLNNLIRRINPDVKVAYVGYAMPLLRAVPVLDNFLGEVNGKKVSAMMLEALNKIVRNGAKLSGHNYVATYNESEWNERPELLSSIFYDIHPTGKGYKKMAQEILLKLSLHGTSTKQDYNHYYDRSFSDAQQWNSKVNYEYWKNDQNSYNRILDLGTNTELVSAIFGSPNNEKLWDNSDLELTPAYVTAIEKNKPNVGVTLRHFLLKNTGILKILSNVVLGFVGKYDKDGSLAKMLTDKDADSDKTRIVKLLEAVLNGKFFVKAIAGVQQEIDNSDLDQNNIAGVQTLSKDILFSALIKQLANKENIKLLINDLLTTKIEGTSKSILNYASPVFVKLLSAMGIGDVSTEEFLLSEDSTGLNNLEKLVQTLMALPAFETILTKMDQAVSLIPSNKIFTLTDLTGALFAGIKNDLNLLHQLIKEFITSDFVQTNNEVVKVELSKVLRGLLATVLGQMLTSKTPEKQSSSGELKVETTANHSPVGSSFKPVVNPFDDSSKIGEFLIKPLATQEFLGKLLEALLENKDDVYSETKTLGEMFKKLIENHKNAVEHWVVDLIKSLVKQPEFRDYYFYEATMGIAKRLKLQTIESKQEQDELKKTDPKKWRSEGYSRFKLATNQELVDIKNLIAFAMDHSLNNSKLLYLNTKSSTALAQKIYKLMTKEIKGVIDGEIEAAKFIQHLKSSIEGLFTYLPAWIPDDVGRAKRFLTSSQWNDLQSRFKKIEKISDKLQTSLWNIFG